MFVLCWIIILFFSPASIRIKVIGSLFAIALFLFFFWKLPYPVHFIEILKPNNNEPITVSQNNTEITIKGRVSSKILPRLEDGSLQIYIIKFTAAGQPYFESKEPAIVNQKGEWTKKIGFYSNQNYKILAIAASSSDIAFQYATTSKAYLSDIISFSIVTGRTQQENN